MAYRGAHRPPFAQAPQVGQASVWDFPRPPELREHEGTLEVRRGDVVIAKTSAGFWICETAHPPTYYFPHSDVDAASIRPTTGRSLCDWKGYASYLDVLGPGAPLLRGAWCYNEPLSPFASLGGAVAFMPLGLACFVDGERARPQPSGFYGGWITSGYVGPFKGEPGITA